MQPPKGYFVVELTPAGIRNLYPMKEWCRQFPEDAPQMNPNTTNSQALRRGFAKMGWGHGLDQEESSERPQSERCDYG